MEAFYGLASYKTCGLTRFLTISIYVYINCLNNFSINSKVRVRAGTSPKSRLKNPRIVKIGILRALLPCIVTSLRAKNLSNLVKVIELYIKIF